MSAVSDSHSLWHYMYGKYTTCNLDCGAGEIVGETFEDDAAALEVIVAEGGHGVRCGACKGYHSCAATVRFCYEVKRDGERYQRQLARDLAPLQS